MVDSDFDAETQRAQSGKGAAERKQEKTPQTPINRERVDTDEHRFYRSKERKRITAAGREKEAKTGKLKT